MKNQPGGEDNAVARHALVPMLLGCGLLVGLLLLLTWTDAVWSGRLILAALVVCLGTMGLMGLATARAHRPERSHHHESGN